MLRMFLIRNGASTVFKNANKPCYLSLRQMSTLGTSAVNQDTVQKDEGLIVFFLGMPGCGKRSLCEELQNAPDGLGDGRPVRYLTGGLTMIGEYWQKVAHQHARNPGSLILADRNATTEVLPAIEAICRNTKAAAVPIIPYSRGTESNPFCLDALAVFMFRVLQRVNHPESLDKNSPIAGYVMLSFYCRHEGMRRKSLEGALLNRFGSLVKMPLLKADRGPLPDDVRSVLEDGLKLYELEKVRQGRWGLTKSSYEEEWANWEKQLRETLFTNADHLHSIQVPFESAVKQVLEQLSLIARGEDELAPSKNPRFFGNDHFALLNLLNADIQRLLVRLALKHPKIDLICKERDMKQHQQQFADIKLASSNPHGIASVASYRDMVLRNVPVGFTALFFNDKMAALEAKIGYVDGKKIDSRYPWPHVEVWREEGTSYLEANTDDLPQLHSDGKATRIEINPPLRTFLFRNGLPFPGGKPYPYLRQMSTMGTSAGEQRASINNDTAHKKPHVVVFVPGDVYKAQNDFLAPYLARQRLSLGKDTVHREAGLIVFFPGIPGCGKHSICKELLNAPGCLGDSRPIDCLTGDFTMKDEYWNKVITERIRNPYSILLADKSIELDGEVWNKIEDICHHTRSSAIPVVPDSIGTESNAFCLDALAVFMFRVLQRVNHPGNLDKDCPNAGYIMLKYYHQYYYYRGRESFEYQLLDQFGSFVKMPLLKDDRSPLPADVKSVLEEGINLYQLEKEREGRWDYTKELYAEEWAKWEKRLQETLLNNADYFNSVQVSFKSAVQQVVEQLSLIAKGRSELAPSNSLRCYGNLGAVDLVLRDEEIQSVLDNLAAKDPTAGAYLKDREMQSQSIVLAFRRFHGLAAVARFGLYLRGSVIDVKLTALVFDENMAALEVQLSADGENISSAFPWTHSIVWGKERALESQTNTDRLPELLAMGKATRIEINPPATVSGKLTFRDFDHCSYLKSQYDTFIKDLILNKESSTKND